MYSDKKIKEMISKIKLIEKPFTSQTNI